MDRLTRMTVLGLSILVVLTVSIYAYLDMQHNDRPKTDPKLVDSCRDLMRQSADILVQVARDDLRPDDPKDSSRLQDFQERVKSIESEMSEIGCLDNIDSWAYGSFRQEMVEYEEYIAELTRMNAVQ